MANPGMKWASKWMKIWGNMGKSSMIGKFQD
jgi:hypothetical protein